MSNDSQIVLPASFIALYVAAGNIKPDASRHQMLERYEFCEDLVQMLLERVKTKQWELGISQDVFTACMNRTSQLRSQPLSTTPQSVLTPLEGCGGLQNPTCHKVC